MPSEEDMRFKLMMSSNALLKYATHESTCPAAGVPHDEATDAPCPCGFREVRKEARRVNAEMQTIFDREDQW